MQMNAKRITLILRIIGVLMLLGLIVSGILQVRDFYADKVGFTPERAIRSYFDALSRGSYSEVYQLTAKEHLTDIYGRPITEREFYSQLRAVTGGNPLSINDVTMTKLCDVDGTYYYLVELSSDVSTATGKSRLVVEVRRGESGWVITYPFAIML